ncbi:MAG: NUDIX hydrolase [Thermoplasmata archaeon]
MTRDFPARPVPAVSGVVFRGEEVLLVRRKVAPYAGQWSLPGGAVEVGETMHEAVKREVREETGLDVHPSHLVGAYDSIVEEEGEIRFHYVLVDFLCELVGGTLTPGTDASAAEWVPLADLETRELTPLARRALAEAARIRGNAAEGR